MKIWKQPIISSVCTKELTSYIKVAARSVLCVSLFFR